MTARDPWGGLGSRMPSEEAYWDDLARRVSQGCAPLLERMGRGEGPWWAAMARHSRALAVVAAAAILAALTLFPRQGGGPLPGDPGPLIRMLTPQDPLVRGLLEGATPPRIETMLVQEGGGQP